MLGCWQPLGDLGLSEADYPVIIEATLASGSTRSNPRPVTEASARRLLDSAR
jgi:alcohol dehydrogenase class IV